MLRCCENIHTELKPQTRLTATMTLLRCYATMHPDRVRFEVNSKPLKPQKRLRDCIDYAQMLCAGQAECVQSAANPQATDKAEILY